MRRAALIVMLAGLVAGGTLATAQTTGHSNSHALFTPAEVKWVDGPPSLPKGAKMAVLEGNLREAGPFTARFILPAGAKIPPHYHPAIEHVTVLSGTFNFGVGEKFDEGQLRPLPAGSFIVI